MTVWFAALTALVAGLVGVRVVPAASQTSTPCYGVDHTMQGNAPQFNVVSFGLFYDCSTFGWDLSITTSDDWSPDSLTQVVIYFNTDADTATGCNGYDRAVVGAGRPGLSAETIITPSCDPSTYLVANSSAFIAQEQPNELDLGFTNNDLGDPSAFSWYGEIEGTGDTSFVRFPAAGAVAEAGFAPTPAANPCPTPAASSKMAVVADSRETPAATDALREAGMSVSNTSTDGVVTFRGDVRRAASALGRAGVQATVTSDREMHFDDTPDDPGYAGQWNLVALNMAPAWTITHGSPRVVVADIDSGVDGSHPDLAGNLAPGWDTTTGGPLASGNTDTNGHGTAVAGLIAGLTNNDLDLASVGWNTRLAEVKVSDPPTMAEIVAGIRWAADQGYPIINLSLSGCNDPTLAAAVEYAQQRGALLVAAVGNDALDGDPVEYPAGYPGVIGVGATTTTGTLAPYSETGAQVSLVAPGGVSDGNSADEVPVLAAGGGTTVDAGTSFAAPEVSATAALILAADPSLSPQDAGALIVSTASRVQTSPDQNYGAGMLSPSAALAAAGRMQRLAGTDRYGTAVAISQAGWPNGSGIAYVTSGENFADALGLGALSGVTPGPILLTASCALPSLTLTELQRLRPSVIQVIGGTDAVCDGIVQALAAGTGVMPQRLAGVDRYATSALIAQTGWPGGASTVYLTTGEDFPDGLTGSARAAKDHAPILLTQTCTLPAPIQAELEQLAPKTIKVIGGPSAVCQSILDELPSVVPGVQVVRIAGADRVATATAVAADGWTGAQTVLLADADNFPDALSAAAYSALTGDPLLINNSCTPDAPVGAELTTLGAASLTVIGGTAALCPQMVAPLVSALKS